MHPDLEILVEELTKIKDNCYGGLKKDSEIYLTHSEIISFTRAFVTAIENQMLESFYGWDSQKYTKVMFYLNLIRTRGIPHCDRSRAAAKCLEVLEVRRLEEEQIDKNTIMEINGYPKEIEEIKDKEWDAIPF